MLRSFSFSNQIVPDLSLPEGFGVVKHYHGKQKHGQYSIEK